MRILILGGGGFIGTRLTEFLSAEEDLEKIYVISRTHLRNFDDSLIAEQRITREISISDLEKHIAGSDAIIDLSTPIGASRHPRDQDGNPINEITKQLRIKTELFEYLSVHKKKLITFLSGGTIYGQDIDYSVDENHPSNPQSIYALNSSLSLDTLKYYRARHDANFTAMLVSNPYGPWQLGKRGQGVIGKWINALHRGESLELIEANHATRDYIYIDDLCNLVSKVLKIKERPKNSYYNASSGRSTRLSTLHQLVQAYYHSSDSGNAIDARISNAGTDGFSLNPLRAITEFGWQPDTSLEAGIYKTIEWHRNIWLPSILGTKSTRHESPSN